MNIALRTESDRQVLELRDLQLDSDKANYRSDLVVRSNGFQLETVFRFEPAVLAQFVVDLERLDSTLCGVARLKPLVEHQFFSLEADRSGAVTVVGEFTDTSDPPRHLRFGFRTDQTCLRALIGEIRKVLRRDVAAYMRVQRTRSTASPPHSPLTRGPLGRSN